MSLVNYLIEGLLPEQEKKKVVAVYGGGLNHPHLVILKLQNKHLKKILK